MLDGSVACAWVVGAGFGLIAAGPRDGACGVDQADVAEGLREVAQEVAAGDVELLREEPEVVGCAQKPIEAPLGPVDVAGGREELDGPESGDDK